MGDTQMVSHQGKGLFRQIAHDLLSHLKQRNEPPAASGRSFDLRLKGLQIGPVFSGEYMRHGHRSAMKSKNLNHKLDKFNAAS
jgi:hypothetical protein